MKRILFFEFISATPHLETTLEIAKRHIDAGDEVHYFFCGHDVPYKYLLRGGYGWPLNCRPELRGAKLIRNRLFHFYPRVKMPRVDLIIPEQFYSISELIRFKYKNCEVGLAAASSLISVTKDSNPDLYLHRGSIQKMLVSGAMVYEFAREKIKTYQPDLVYIFNGRQCNHRSVMNAAENMETEYLLHERGANKYRYSVREFMPHDRIRLQDDMLKLWRSSGDRKIAEGFFQARRRGEEQGWTSFASKYTQGLLPKLNPAKRIVSYFSSSDDEFAAVGDIFRWERWPNQVQALKELVEVCGNAEDIQLVVRLHPHLAKKSRRDYERWTRFQLPKESILILPEDKIDSYTLIDHSDIVVTGGSTIGIEAVFWKTPSICLGPSFYTELGAVHLPDDSSGLSDLLNSSDLSCDPDKALPFGFYLATFGEEFKYYTPETLFTGKFLGVDLQSQGVLCRITKDAHNVAGRMLGVISDRLAGKKHERSVNISI